MKRDEAGAQTNMAIGQRPTTKTINKKERHMAPTSFDPFDSQITAEEFYGEIYDDQFDDEPAQFEPPAADIAREWRAAAETNRRTHKIERINGIMI